MALTKLVPLKFNLFVTNKGMTKVDQPGYSVDMRTIENGVNLFINKLVPDFNNAIDEINAALAEIDTIINIDIPKFEFGNPAVGTTPPANTQFIDYSTTVSVTTNASGNVGVPLSGFTHGYSALVTPNWPGLMSSVDLGASTLSNLELNFQDTTGPYGPETFTVTIRVVGA